MELAQIYRRTIYHRNSDERTRAIRHIFLNDRKKDEMVRGKYKFKDNG